MMRKYTQPVINEVARFFNYFSRGKLSPNGLTLITLLLHLVVIWLIISQHLVWAGVSLILFSSLDAIDGALARIQKRVTDFGGWLDACSDRLKEILVFVGLTYYLIELGEPTWILLLAISCLASALLISYIKAKAEAIIAAQTKISFTKLNRIFGGGWGYDLRVLILGLTLIINQIPIGLIVLILGSIYTIISRSFKFKKALKSKP